MTDEALPKEPLVAKWVQAIKIYEKETDKWTERSRKIVKRYKDEREGNDSAVRFNVLWSNIETLKPALYAKTPKAQVERRFHSEDPVGRVTSNVLERAISYFVGTEGFGAMMRQSVLDYLLPGRGTIWVRYVPHFKDAELRNGETADDGTQVSEDAEKGGDVDHQPPKELTFEEVIPDYVHWEDYGHTICRTWEENTAVWRKVYMSRERLRERFPEYADDIPLDMTPRENSGVNVDGALKKATIYEIWDLDTKQAIWISKEFPKVLDKRDDPLKLPKFFPCPRPLYATLGNDSLIPVPDYIEYQDQAKELDDLTARINSITKAIKVTGVYDSSAEGLSRLLTEGVENQLLPIKSWSSFAEKGGLAGAMDFLPIQEMAQTLLGLYEARDRVKNDLYEVTGMADIIRGATNANETATAQKIKSNFVTMRLDERQREVERFARNVIEIIGQIIATHFDINTIKEVSGVQLLMMQEKQQIQAIQAKQQQLQQLDQQQPGNQQIQSQLAQLPQISDDQLRLIDQPTWDEVEALLKNTPIRGFRIDIETNSLTASDEDQDKQDRLDFLNAVGTYMGQAAEVAQSMPQAMPLMANLLLFAVRSFPVGKDIESKFVDVLDQIEQAQKNPPPEKPDPEMEKIKAQSQAQAQQIDNDHQAKMKELDLKAQQQDREHTLKQQEMNTKLSLMRQETDSTIAATNAKTQNDIDTKQRMADAKSQVIVGADGKAAKIGDTTDKIAQSAQQIVDAAGQLMMQGSQQTEALAQRIEILSQQMAQPKKKSITIKRDGAGRATGAEVSE